MNFQIFGIEENGYFWYNNELDNIETLVLSAFLHKGMRLCGNLVRRFGVFEKQKEEKEDQLCSSACL